jgi:hypothetical protein
VEPEWVIWHLVLALAAKLNVEGVKVEEVNAEEVKVNARLKVMMKPWLKVTPGERE